MIIVSKRFLEVYEYLISLKLVENGADFCRKIGISSSMFTEISKGRTNVGLQAIQKTVQSFSFINSNWILTGDGTIDLRYIESTDTPNAKENFTLVSKVKTANIDPPTLNKIDTPSDTPTSNLGMPRVILINDKDEDLVPFIGAKAAAGYLNGYADPEFIEKQPTIRMPGLRGGTHRAFEVKGHSMPTLPNSSIAVGRWTESIDDIRDRRIYIVVTKTEGIVIKRVLNRVSDTGKLILISDNQNKREYPNIILDQSDVVELWYLRGGLIFEFPEPGELYGRFNELEAKVSIMAEQMQKLLK